MKTTKQLPLIYPDAAGIDIGSEMYYVCVPTDRDAQPVRKFGCFIPDLHELATWLKSDNINIG